MALPGGAADKFGNQYESWWTIVRLMDVNSGRAHSILLEPPSAEGLGVEFVVRDPNVSVFEQVKSGQSRTSWSLKRANSELLMPAMSHLSGGDLLRLVLAVDAPQLRLLAERARTDPASTEAHEDVLALADSWGVSADVAVSRLGRVDVAHYPPSNLRKLAQVRVEAVVAGDPDLAIRAIHGWLFDQVHRELFASDIRSFLRSEGFVIRDLLGDSATAEDLARTARSFSARVDSSSGSTASIRRQYSDAVVEALQSESRRIVVHGAPGAGKTQVIRQVLEDLTEWNHAVVRMDALQTATLTATQLGEAIGLSGSPSTLLGALSGESSSLLIIDQLDAVSSFSGRLTDSFGAVEEMLEGQTAWPNMRILLAIRTVDFKNDPRMTEISSRPRTSVIEIKGYSNDEREQLLLSSDTDLSRLRVDDALTRSPLYLRLLIDTHSTLEGGTELTSTGLFDALEAKRRHEWAEKVDGQRWTDALNGIARRLSDSERLNVKTSELAEFEPAISQLTSAGLLVQDGLTTAFFHEQYMDHVFAREFVGRGGDIREFLKMSGQALFRRSQARQVLQRVRDVHPRLFFEVCSELVADSEIRLHLKQIVFGLLKSSTPSPSDWTRFAGFANERGYVGDEVRSFLLAPRWFDAAHRNDAIRPLLESPFSDQVARAVLMNLGDRPTTVVSLMTRFLDDPAAEPWFREMMAGGRNLPSLPFIEELLERGHLDTGAADGTQTLSRSAWHAFYSLSPSDENSIWWLEIILRRAFKLGTDQGLKDPLDQDFFSDSSTWDKEMAALANHQPRAFLDASLPIVVGSARTTERTDSATGKTRSRWDSYFSPQHGGVDQAILNALTIAVEAVSETADGLTDTLASIGTETSAVLTLLAFHAHIGHDDPDRAIEWLIDDPASFELRWDGESYFAATRIISTFANRADEKTLTALLLAIHAEVPDVERSTYGWRWHGRAEWQLLHAFPLDILPPASRRRTEELDRKFEGQNPRSRNETMGGIVGSPIPTDAAAKMSNSAWLRAIAKYDSARTLSQDDFLKGGSRELAQLLEATVPSDPTRFLELANSLPSTAAPEYRSALLSGLAPVVSSLDFAAIALAARVKDGESCGRVIAWGAEKQAAPWPAELVDIICDVARDEDPRPDSTASWSNSDSLSHQLSMLGLNSNRGAAAHALTKHLWEIDAITPSVAASLTALASDSVAAVRSATARAVGAVSRTDRALTLSLANTLFSHGLEVLATSEGFVLFRFAAVNDEVFRRTYVSAGLSCDEPETAKHAGATWAALDYHGLLSPTDITDYGGLPELARVGVAWAWCGSEEPDLDLLLAVLKDPAEVVRDQAHGAIRQMTALRTSELGRLVGESLSLPTFAAVSEHLVDLLESSRNQLPPEALDLARQILHRDDLNELTHVGRSSALMLPDLFKVLTRLSRQDPSLYGEEVLDCIDLLVQTDSARVWRLLDLDGKE